jgi:transcriptional regulator with XRE-family HTH domain
MAGKGKRGRPPDETRRQLVAELRTRGLSLAEVGRELGVSKQAVHQLLRAAAVSGRGHVRCAAYGAAVARSALRPPRGPAVLCLACLSGRPGAPFAERLKAHRLAAGLTQAELARRAGLAKESIGKYERGHARPGPKSLARVLGPGLG